MQREAPVEIILETCGGYAQLLINAAANRCRGEAFVILGTSWSSSRSGIPMRITDLSLACRNASDQREHLAGRLPPAGCIMSAVISKSKIPASNPACTTHFAAPILLQNASFRPFAIYQLLTRVIPVFKRYRGSACFTRGWKHWAKDVAAEWTAMPPEHDARNPMPVSS